MLCQLCGAEVSGVLNYTPYDKAIKVCITCYPIATRELRAHPYSKLSDKIALLSAGYYVNRKFARMR